MFGGMLLELTPFNGIKVLVHSDKIEAILKDQFMPPVSCEIDPSNICNHKCPNCMFTEFKTEKPTKIPRQELMQLIRDLSEMGVKSVTFTGGGEPLTSPHTLGAMELANNMGLEVGLVTNGGLLDNHSCEVILNTCKFVRVSLDAGTADTHKKMHGTNDFDRIVLCLKSLSNNNVFTDIGVAFLVHQDNYNEIVDCARLIKKIGVNYLQVRPIWLKNGMLPYQVIHAAQEHIHIAQKLNTEHFKVYGILHRFDEHLYEHRGFDKCRATPLLGVVGADCNIWLCCQYRGIKGYSIGNLMDSCFREIWGSEHHKQIIDKINLDQCPPCRYKLFNQIIEKVFIEDTVHKNFI